MGFWLTLTTVQTRPLAEGMTGFVSIVTSACAAGAICRGSPIAAITRATLASFPAMVSDLRDNATVGPPEESLVRGHPKGPASRRLGLFVAATAVGRGANRSWR